MARWSHPCSVRPSCIGDKGRLRFSSRPRTKADMIACWFCVRSVLPVAQITHLPSPAVEPRRETRTKTLANPGLV